MDYVPTDESEHQTKSELENVCEVEQNLIDHTKSESWDLIVLMENSQQIFLTTISTSYKVEKIWWDRKYAYNRCFSENMKQPVDGPYTVDPSQINLLASVFCVMWTLDVWAQYYKYSIRKIVFIKSDNYMDIIIKNNNCTYHEKIYRLMSKGYSAYYSVNT